VLLLGQLNEAYATLGVLAFAARVHPFVAYTELCRIVGSLSLFGASRRTGEVPRYDHDDLARIFYWAKEQIQLLAMSGPRDEYEQRPFVGSGLGMQATFEDKWLAGDWKWFVGVQHENISDDECAQLIGEKGAFDWKLGSKPRVEMLFNYGQPGLTLLPLNYTPQALPRTGWRYYEVSREGPEWKEVQSTKTLAMRFLHRLIENPQDLPGKRRIVMNYRGKRADLEFALFAVRTVT
jgi:type VI secretion system protein ImpJ